MDERHIVFQGELQIAAISEKQSGVYAIVNMANGRRYVGSSKNIERRWTRHRTDLKAGKHHSIALQRAWAKHGDRFEFVVLEYVEGDQLLAREQAHMDERADYNCAPHAGHKRGTRWSPAQRTAFMEWLRKAGPSRAGAKHSDEARAKMSASRRGVKRQPLSESTRALLSQKAKGRVISQEQREKISATLKGRKRDPELVAQSAISHRGMTYKKAGKQNG